MMTLAKNKHYILPNTSEVYVQVNYTQIEWHFKLV